MLDIHNELSTRASNVLEQEGYEDKEQVRVAINDGSLYYQTRKRGCIPNYGKRTHEEVVKWVKELANPE